MNAAKLLKIRRVRQKENRASVPKWRLVKFDARVKRKGLTNLILILLAVFISTGIHISVARVSVAQPKTTISDIANQVPIRLYREPKDEPKPEPVDTKPEPSDHGTGVASNAKPRDAGDGSGKSSNVSTPSGGLGEMIAAMTEDSKIFDGNAIDPTLEKDLANLNGPTGFDARGTSGLGMFGAGQSGGGGKALGIDGPWNFGKGRCRGSDCRLGGGPKVASLKKPEGYEVIPTPNFNIVGEDPNNVRKMIEKHLNSFRYCYQKELSRNPLLYGKITVRFQYNQASKGQVTMATIAGSTMNNAAVEDCMLRVVRNIIFLPPKSGAVIVNYPFIFKSRQ